MNKHFTTSKGTQLPLLNLRGKDYLEVKYRVVWFREEHPDWSIETAFTATDDESACARAVIRDASGRVLATSHKTETVKGFPDFLEKAETGAIGRALALVGYGTAFCADEFDEGQRIVDAPAQRPQRAHMKLVSNGEAAPLPAAAEAPSSEPEMVAETPEEPVAERRGHDFGKYLVAFGKYRGKRLHDVARKDLESYLSWLRAQANKKHSPLSAEASILTRMAELYFAQLDQHADAAPTAEGQEFAA